MNDNTDTNNNDNLQSLIAEARDLKDKILVYAVDVEKLHSDLGSNPGDHAEDMRKDDETLHQDTDEGGLGLAESLQVQRRENLQDACNAIVLDTRNEELVIEATEQQLKKLENVEKIQEEVIKQDLVPIYGDFDGKVKRILTTIGVDPEKLKHDGILDRDLAWFFVEYASIPIGTPRNKLVEVHIDFVPANLTESAIEDLTQLLGGGEADLHAIANHQFANGNGWLTIMDLELMMKLTKRDAVEQIYRVANSALEARPAF